MRLPASTTVAIVLAAVALSGCQAMRGDAPDGLSGFARGDVAAEVGEHVVTTAELAAAVEDSLSLAATADMSETERLEQRIEVQTNQLSVQISIAIVSAAASDEFGIVIDDADVAASVTEAAEQAGGEEALAEALAAQGLTLASFEQQARVTLLVERITAALVEADPLTDEDIEAEFDQRRGEFEQVTARHILVGTEAEAVAALARLEAGEDFAALAQELSLDTGSAEAGGSLGSAPRGSFVPEFEAAIWDGPAPVGAVLGPVETQFGHHLIIVDEFVVTPEAEAREAVRQELEGTYGQDLFGFWVRQAIADADPKVAPRLGHWDRVGQSVVRGDAEDARVEQSQPEQP